MNQGVKKGFLHFFILFCLICYFTVLPDNVLVAENQPSWVRVSGSSFVKDNKPFKFIGATCVNLLLYDDWNLDIEKCIKSAKENNISVLRFYIDWKWAKYEDFDVILNLISKYGMHAILSLADCCCSSNFSSLEKYFEVHTPFCNIKDNRSVEAFKRRIKQVIERKNSINGKIYRDDPVILAWEIANELEFEHFSKPQVHAWIEELSGYIKSLDKNHLVTIGIATDSAKFTNDRSLYQMFNAPALGFFSFHMYPSSQNINPMEDAPRREVINKIEHITKEFISMGKPVIMGEFGFSNSADLNFKVRTSQETQELYNSAFKRYMDAAFLAGSSGVMFWGWGVAEEKTIPMWWSRESHSPEDKMFCGFLKGYNIPN